jgi:predicted transcriptional regulator
VKRVYFLRPVGQIGPIKIGCSKLPELRLETITVWSPVRLELICSVPGSHKDERALHGMFAKHHAHGEWFGASKELLALIDHCELHGELPPLPEVIAFPRTRHVGHKGRAKGKREPGELSQAKMELARLYRAQHESGMTVTDIAREAGRSKQTVGTYIRAAGGTVKWPRKTKTGIADAERAAIMRERYLAGETLQQIGDTYGLTRERVRQLLRKLGVESLGLRPEHFQKPHELTEAELLAVKLYAEGVRPKVIQEKTGLGYQQIRGALERQGVKRHGAGEWLTRPDDAEITRRTCELYLAGLSAPEIVKRVPQLKHPETVYRYLKKGGVRARTNRGNFRFRRLSASA